MKYCPQCQTLMPLSGFSPRSGARSHQLRSWCKECTCAKSKEDRLLDLESARSREREYARRRAIEAPEQLRENARRSRERNREALRDRQREWVKKNPGYNNQWAREAYRTNADYRFAILVRGRLVHALKADSAKKSARTLDLLGCPMIWFKIHLASLFRPGMTWENHGAIWEIDHIRPCASFDLTDPEQQKSCFHWANQQPLFVSENRRKSASYVKPEQPPIETCGRCCQAAPR